MDKVQPPEAVQVPQKSLHTSGTLMAREQPVTFSPPSSPISERRRKPIARPTNLEPVPESTLNTEKYDQNRRHGDVSQPSRELTSREMSKRRSQYFHEALHERNGSAAADLVRQNSLILAELKTNVEMKDEYQYMVEISEHLAKIYHRSVASIVLTLERGRCMAFGGSFEPSYILRITALPCEVQTATNKQNTAVLQNYMESIFQIPSSRGMVYFISVGEECMGWGGRTVIRQIRDAMGRGTPDTDESRTQDRSILKSLSLRRSGSAVTKSNTEPRTPSINRRTSSLSSTPSQVLGMPRNQDQKSNAIKKKKSIIHTLFRSSKYESVESKGQ